jgi:hypothetical protein
MRRSAADGLRHQPVLLASSLVAGIDCSTLVVLAFGPRLGWLAGGICG